MNTSTKRIENNKNFDSELDLIENLNSLNGLEIKIVEYKDIKASISKNKGGFKLDINSRLIEELESDIIFSFILNGNTYETKKIGGTSLSTELKVDEYVSFLTSIEINSFCSKHFNSKDLFKAFFIVDLKEINTFHAQFETVTHTRNETEYFYDCLRINLNEKRFDITQLKNEKKGFYVLECLEEQNFEDFSKACFSIQQAIGFINGLMVGGEEFIFDYSGKLYYTNYIRPTIKGMYSPIITNPYSYPDIERKIAEKFKNKLTRISLDNLSNLVHKIHSEPKFSVAILVILEATSIRSLLIIPSSFAVIIELLSKHLSVEECGLKTPISDNKLQKKIIKELHNVIDNNSKYLNDESILELKKRLNYINKPINKQHLTNNEKLSRVFKQLRINLTLHDISIIEHRNDLLHGNILLKNNDNRNEGKTDLYMAYVSAKLFTLISKLILKSIRYNGYVYNQAKFLEKYLDIETDEEYFEKI